MVDKKEIKFFKRYLKNKGLFHAFFRDARISHNFDGRRTVSEALKRDIRTYNLIMDCILWSVSLYNGWNNRYIKIITIFINYFYSIRIYRTQTK